MQKQRVLVTCVQNSARSQMTEAFLKKYGEDLFEVYSAGLEPAGVNPLAIKVMSEIGINIENQRSKSFKEFLGHMQFSYVIAVCRKVENNCPFVFPVVRNYLSWPFDDPAAAEGSDEERLIAFRKIRDQIEEQVIMWIRDYRNGKTD